MNPAAISVKDLGKAYRLGGVKTQHDTLRDAVAARLHASWQRRRADAADVARADEQFWALRDVSFETPRGSVLGVVGRNGAGKSTLLKILSRITEPTMGRVVISGRVGSLLEVGTGFHTELTGRENILLSGAIHGMSRAETLGKFDRIVSFAGVERFLDTPVKRYSSGMYVRLAFAVAAHMEPDVLLVDEVLAVGDLAFQQKCMRHMEQLRSSGMTILLVSHNMAAIQSICDHALLLDAGRLVVQGKPMEVIERYRQLQNVTGSIVVDQLDAGRGDPGADEKRQVTITHFEMIGEDGVVRRDFRFGEAIRVRIEVEAHQRVDQPFINFGIRRGDGVTICNFNNWYDGFSLDYIEGKCSLEGWLPPLRLTPDFYEAHVLVWPWGGGHVQGEITQAMPLAWTSFGDFRIVGPGLNTHDGVFQMPAQKWLFRRLGHEFEYVEMTNQSIFNAFDGAENI